MFSFWPYWKSQSVSTNCFTKKNILVKPKFWGANKKVFLRISNIAQLVYYEMATSANKCITWAGRSAGSGTADITSEKRYSPLYYNTSNNNNNNFLNLTLITTMQFNKIHIVRKSSLYKIKEV